MAQLIGTNDDDLIKGTQEADAVFGLGGDDLISTYGPPRGGGPYAAYRAQAEARYQQAGRSAGLVRRALVTVQVALAFVLLMGAGLLFASFRELLAVDVGFRADHVLSATLDLPDARYRDTATRVAFVQRLNRNLDSSSVHFHSPTLQRRFSLSYNRLILWPII